MLIVCGKCASAYEVDADLLGDGGADVACEACGHCWFAQNEAVPHLNAAHGVFTGPPLIEAQAGGARTAAESYGDLYGTRRKTPPRAPKRWPRPRAGAAACVGLAALMGAIAGREAIVRAVPASASVFAAAGLPVNLRGIRFEGVTSTTSEEPGGRVLAISGILANTGKTSVPVPAVIVALRGPDGRDVYSWGAAAPKAELAPGETVVFRTRLAAPPDTARDVMLRFASAAEAARARGQK